MTMARDSAGAEFARLLVRFDRPLLRYIMTFIPRRDDGGQRHLEGRALAFAGTGCGHRAAVQLDQVPDDGKSQAKPRMLARGRAFGLPEGMEHIGQEVGCDAAPDVADGQLCMRVDLLQADLDVSIRLRELDGIGEQVPDYLLQAFRIAGD